MSAQSAIFNPTQTTSAATGDGFSVPRLTTTGRLAISFGTSDAGMMVYDTTLNNLFIWTGAAWESVPASGDAGANGAVQYNDNGVVSGAAGFFWNKVNQKVGIGTATPNVELDVVGNSSITGDLTVDTSTLKVDSTNNRVGIGTASPGYPLHVSGIDSEVVIQDSNTPVGSNPASLLSFWGSASRAGYIGYPGDNNLYINQVANSSMLFLTNNTERARLDSSGNLGLGVTPSAWNTVTGFQIAGGASLAGFSNTTYLSNNAYYNSGTGWTYITNAAATQYYQNSGKHIWQTASASTGAITFTQAMTLDASGRLGVGVVPASNVRAHFKGSSTSTDSAIYCVNSSDKLTLSVRNDGLFVTGSLADVATLPNSPYNLTTGSAANVYVDSQGIFYRSTSSIKYKTDVTDSVRGLADVLKLRPVTYKAKNSGNTVFGGLIAEEVAAAGLTEFVQFAPDNTPDAIHYGNMISLLVSAIKELTAEVNALKNA